MGVHGNSIIAVRSSIELQCSSSCSSSSCSSVIYQSESNPAFLANQEISSQSTQIKAKKFKDLQLRPNLEEVIQIGPKFAIGNFGFYKSFARGAYSKVRVIRDLDTDLFYALKEAHNRPDLSNNRFKKSKNPVGQIMLESNCDNHVRLVSEKLKWGIQHPPKGKVIIEGVYETNYVAVIEELYEMDLDRYQEINQPAVPDLLFIIDQMISALAYCHQIGMVRTDQKLSNYLVKILNNEDKTYTLVHRCDFSDLFLEDYSVTNPPPKKRVYNRLTTVMQEYYQATVYAERGKIEEFKALVMQQEIFAMGIVLYELIMGPSVTPYPYLFDEIRLYAGLKPIVREDIPLKLSDLVHSMLDSDPKKRPSAATVLEKFNAVWIDFPDVFAKIEEAKSFLGYV